MQCTIYTPSAAIGQVRWYWSESKGLAGVSGELVSVREFDSCSQIMLDSSVTQVACDLIITNFISQVNGYYWCQIEANGTCFSSSPPGHVNFNVTHNRYCQNESIVGSSLFAMGQPPICPTPSRCSVDSQLATILASSSLLPTATPSPGTDPEGGSKFTLWCGIIGVLVFVVSATSAALTLFVVWLSQRRAFRTKSNGKYSYFRKCSWQ